MQIKPNPGTAEPRKSETGTNGLPSAVNPHQPSRSSGKNSRQAFLDEEMDLESQRSSAKVQPIPNTST